jgi:hypothetical protein
MYPDEKGNEEPEECACPLAFLLYTFHDTCTHAK